MRMRFVVPAAVAAAALGVVAFFAVRTGDDGSAAAPSASAAPAPSAVVAPAAALVSPLPAPAATASTGDDEAMWLLPDGSRIATLNGARSPRPLQEAWPRGVPWSPIVGFERSPAGVDWYVHADGSKSTTEMKWRADLARYDAVTRLARPTPQAPGAPRM
jgi:hypothetical protein